MCKRCATAGAAANGCLSPQQPRAITISQFEQWLRPRTNQEKRAFLEKTA
jgi:hypothetical protein